MILATHNCGCPLPPKKLCNPAETHMLYSLGTRNSYVKKPVISRSTLFERKSISQECVCDNTERNISVIKAIHPEGSISCDPSCSVVPKSELISDKKSPKIFSEIARNGLPYKELEAVINNHKIVVRTQSEPQATDSEFSPPCDCPTNPEVQKKIKRASIPVEEDLIPGSNVCKGCRRVSVVPLPEKLSKTESKEGKPLRAIDCEDNPNLFVLRIKKTSDKGSKKQNLDLEFKTAQPWSDEMIRKYELLANPPRVYQDIICGPPRRKEKRLCRIPLIDLIKYIPSDENQVSPKKKRQILWCDPNPPCCFSHC